MTKYKPVVLIILDGWGVSPNTQGNAIRRAELPTINKLNTFYPLVLLQASGNAVGLPWGEAGNSEVGHITLGTGRIIYQNMPRITLSIQDGTFFTNPSITKTIDFAKNKGGKLHLMGLISTGSVHSYIEHLYALLEAAKKAGLSQVYVHAFTDGRDSAPDSGIETLTKIQRRFDEFNIGKFASIIGRNWAMDRNNNWERIEKAYHMLTEGKGEKITSVNDYLQESYKKEVFDEFVEPGLVVDPKTNEPIALIEDNDGVIFFNFREDRARQLTKAFTLPGFEKFERKKYLEIEFCTMVEYEENLPVEIAFASQDVNNSLGELLSKNNLHQLRIAETEKYAHVTYFFNGGAEEPFPGEDRLLVPSPIVPSFDKEPEMSAGQVTEKVIEKIRENKYDFVLINYANPDMVGHTGNEEATIKACESVDKTLSILLPEILNKGGCVFITADHGNAEEIKNNMTGKIDTEHSTNPVPLWYITPTNHRQKTAEEIIRQENEVVGLLSDVAPTILELMSIERPSEMLGNSLLPILESR